MEDQRVQLLGPQEIRALAQQVGIVPTKKLGQNFVHDPNTVRMIIAAAQLSPEDHVVEIGPGLGSLTLGLLDTVRTVTAVEIDPRLAAQLPHTVAQYAPAVRDNLQLIHQDALSIQAQDIDQPTALVANLPYNVSVPVLLHFLEIFPSIKRVLVMVQAEVADRLSAAPGSKIYGVPSVKAAYYGRVKRAGSIGKKIFWPAPKIDSGLVRIDVYDDQECAWPRDAHTRQTVFQLVDQAFAQRRKTLRAALSGLCGGGEYAENILRAADIDPTLRGEKLGVQEYVRLAQAYVAHEHESVARKNENA
ncbi:16S rRNA (adenine(1518)-N(6)/adenine(1519)-N(6))-dimethyltransferase RsmA [Corynebacterium sp. sy017]|uniref:16S rRNA (adenine(1518)-N(6)/adenine(1519)-N(6))- dimethyltransferase RsmA n=1 Tax=unclassified Corynebacterium TaxID=2624378 RepID=UPI001186EA11|nr:MULTISPECIES: 16S rRNA (adenine(1518)-N(6)/adenine(1519)-N(6))-dimethyltransferase RsmA [unclassified Corynebacterium]MBP3088869.1 16S rRNA (adenine(1518)-N(6)/adenine(1519)-N(6))-dimethyltransferase RsmA [Corynebacterium sp. sy017]QDZ42259.1 16S rRNA (adenine(1518)-N(6)/adenine(1519)-N(6))-dimethyltransferase RsmA [Corynebacterium sp. sy039]TSD91210.1 16S rRNA (adenine(1518)-N(6)/adenine(1519)-N(6))-dimethyltransferase RsmA [Corynebacterium sp. SY003]